MDFKLGMAQMLVEGGQPAANLARAVAYIERAAAEGCQVVLLPECLDLGWTHPSARQLAQPIPGAYSEQLAGAARQCGVYVVAGLVERAADRLYNAAVVLDPQGQLLHVHRKINELHIAHDLYAIGDRLGVVETPLARLGINICADNFAESLVIGHVLARMGAQVILSPSAWVVNADHDNERQPYGSRWLPPYTELSRLYDLTVVGVSHVGWVTGGPWQGRKAIGCSLAVGPGGEVLARGPYGVDAEALLVVTVKPQPPIGRGTQIAEALSARGYVGP